MSLLGVGTLAFDTIYTPLECRERVIGGSATYFAYAASFFGPVRLVGMVGNDWPEEHFELFRNHGIDTSGVLRELDRKSYFWCGRYDRDLEDRDTLEIQINGFDQFDPVVPQSYMDSQWVFLAAAAPSVQLKTLAQCRSTQLVVADTVDMWIETEKADLLKLLQNIDGLLINASEARQLTQHNNLVKAGRAILELGPDFVILKKGEHGCLLFEKKDVSAIPGYPTDAVVDPTGAGDSFAGGMMGYLANSGDSGHRALRNAIAYGAVVASFTISGFGLDGLIPIDRKAIDSRLVQFKQMLKID
jgi:cytidine kinase